MSTLHLNLREGKRHILLAIVTALSLVAGFLVAPPSAQADVNTGIKVIDLKLTASDQNGNPLNNNAMITRDTAARLDFNWDASGTRVKSGDTFTIDLPEQFQSWRNYEKHPLVVDHNGQSVQVGDCNSETKTINCVFNDKVDELNADGYRGIEGSGWAVFKVLGEHEGPAIDFVVNGEKTAVDLPGGKIPGIPGDYFNMGFGKMAAYLGPNTDSITWDINFNSTHVKNLLKDTPQALTVDGKTSQTITFEDILGPGQKFNPNTGNFQLMIRNSKNHPANILKPLAFVSGAKDKVVTEYGDFTIAFDRKNDQEGTFTLTGPWAEDTNYKIVYTSLPDSADGHAVADHAYYNESTIKGSTQKAHYSRQFSRSFDVTARLLPGFGGLEVTKKVANDPQNKVPAESEYIVNIEYTLPNNTTASNYPTWTPVGTLNDAKTGGTASMTVKANEAKRFTGQFPTGTTVKLTEERSTLPNGIQWRDPEFTVNGKSADTFTVEELKHASVELTNEVARIDVSPLPNPDQNDPTNPDNPSDPVNPINPTDPTDPNKPDNNNGSSGNGSSGAGSATGSSRGSSISGSSVSPWWLLLGIAPLLMFLPPHVLKHFQPSNNAQVPAQAPVKQGPRKG